jgi:hypothetical protein
MSHEIDIKILIVINALQEWLVLIVPWDSLMYFSLFLLFMYVCMYVFIYLFLVILVIELRASGFLGRCSTTSPLFLFFF